MKLNEKSVDLSNKMFNPNYVPDSRFPPSVRTVWDRTRLAMQSINTDAVRNFATDNVHTVYILKAVLAVKTGWPELVYVGQPDQLDLPTEVRSLEDYLSEDEIYVYIARAQLNNVRKDYYLKWLMTYAPEAFADFWFNEGGETLLRSNNMMFRNKIRALAFDQRAKRLK